MGNYHHAMWAVFGTAFVGAVAIGMLPRFNAANPNRNHSAGNRGP